MQQKLKISRSEGGPSFYLCLDSDVPTEAAIHESLKNSIPYEPDVTALFYLALREGDIVVDVGANIGWFSMLSASLVGPTGRVFAFEADPKNVARICKNIEANQYDNVTAVEAALSDDTAAAKFYINPKGNGGSALWKSEDGSTTIDLITRRLDEFADKIGGIPKIIKIDVEGAEECVLRGATKFLGKTPFVVAELHIQGLREQHSSQMGMRQMMREYGYETFLLSQDGDLPMFVPHGTEVLTEWVQNILFTKQELVSELWPRFYCGMGVRYPEEKEAIDASTKHD